MGVAFGAAPVDLGAWTAFTPVVTPGAGAITTYVASGFYKLIGKTCFVRVRANITSNGTGTTSLVVTLPFTALSNQFMGGIESAVTKKGVVALVSNGVAYLTAYFYDGTYPAADGYGISFTGVYETL